MNENGTQPSPKTKLYTGITITDVGGSLSSDRFGQHITTDQDGWFTLTELVPGWKYQCILAEHPGGRVLPVITIQVGAGKSIELGELKTPTPPKPYVPPTLEERIERAFSVAGTAEERFDKAKDMIQAADQNLLVVFGQPKDPRIHDLMKIRYQDEDYQKLSEDYLVLAIPTDSEHIENAQELARRFDSEAKLKPDGNAFLVALLNPAAEQLAVLNSSQLCDGEQLSKDRLIEHLDKFKIATLNGQTLLDEALKTARQENKRVLIQESATWCGPCHRLSQLLDENRQWEQDYVWVRMDRRWTKAREIMKKIRDGAEGGIPWFAILDADGKVLATSNNPDTGDNIGFPSSAPSQKHFVNMLKTTRQRMSNQEIQNLANAASTRD